MDSTRQAGDRYQTSGAADALGKLPKEVHRLVYCHPKDLAMAMRLSSTEEITAARDYCVSKGKALQFRLARLNDELEERAHP